MHTFIGFACLGILTAGALSPQTQVRGGLGRRLEVAETLSHDLEDHHKLAPLFTKPPEERKFKLSDRFLAHDPEVATARDQQPDEYAFSAVLNRFGLVLSWFERQGRAFFRSMHRWHPPENRLTRPAPSARWRAG